MLSTERIVFVHFLKRTHSPSLLKPMTSTEKGAYNFAEVKYVEENAEGRSVDKRFRTTTLIILTKPIFQNIWKAGRRLYEKVSVTVLNGLIGSEKMGSEVARQIAHNVYSLALPAEIHGSPNVKQLERPKLPPVEGMAPKRVPKTVDSVDPYSNEIDDKSPSRINSCFLQLLKCKTREVDSSNKKKSMSLAFGKGPMEWHLLHECQSQNFAPRFLGQCIGFGANGHDLYTSSKLSGNASQSMKHNQIPKVLEQCAQVLRILAACAGREGSHKPKQISQDQLVLFESPWLLFLFILLFITATTCLLVSQRPAPVSSCKRSEQEWFTRKKTLALYKPVLQHNEGNWAIGRDYVEEKMHIYIKTSSWQQGPAQAILLGEAKNKMDTSSSKSMFQS
ncbi:Alkaline phosphatase, tissue-nonspecific isozyme [Varanus komodoensis]|nr:Alkaline phosphatase, tissue-nonspecific isozyme [Varanus komodoensis]